MWVFGYGSLMWDGWERALGCDHRAKAVLQGYRRTFNKASVRNWGTRDCKCLTLNLEKLEDAKCVGIAFRFPAAKSEEVMATLEKREGKGFPFLERAITVLDLGEFSALVPIYSGPNLVPREAIPDAIRLMRDASGTSGTCIDYVRGVQKMLSSLDIDDASVRDVWAQLNSKL